MAKIQVSTNNGLAIFMKSIFVAVMKCAMESDFIRFRSSKKLKIKRVTTSAVNKLAATPMVSVTPKPWISPVPFQIKITEEISVVTCESKIVLNARS